MGRAGGTPRRWEFSLSPLSLRSPCTDITPGHTHISVSSVRPQALTQPPDVFQPQHRLLSETWHPFCKADPGRGGQGQCSDLWCPPHPHHLLHGACPAPQLTGVCVLTGRRGKSSRCPHRSHSLPPSPLFPAKAATLALSWVLFSWESRCPQGKGS